MKLSEQWLREWVSPRLDTKALVERLTMAGLEVGAVEPVAPEMNKVVVGRIESIAPHPSADSLRLCRVDVGKGNRLDVVCGAPNAAEGLRAPVALEGAKLPDGTILRRSEIRGVVSSGMLCSAAELGLGDSGDGLLVLDADAKPGTPLPDYLQLDDSALEVELTPNRGDCLSVTGLARELAAITGAKLKSLSIKPVKPKQRRRLVVKLEAPQACARYVGRVVSGIRPEARTPLWMREKLRRSGVRSIHPVVDVTNYVMLELGQPMHAFDLARIEGSIRVRYAAKNETLTLLDGSRLELEPGSLLIADEARPLALAGVMGGAESAVGEGTRDLFLESAWFRPQSIAASARHYGLHSESSYRFERGVDPALQRTALERATSLLLSIVGGQAGPLIERSAPRHLPRRRPIRLRRERIERILGVTISDKDVTQVLQRLAMPPRKNRHGWQVLPPSYRSDLAREIDLVEEIARIHGYDRIPIQRPRLEMTAPPLSEADVGEARLRTLLSDRDYQEVITYSFVDPKLQAALDPERVPARLANPISADMAVMRTSLWPGLLQTLAYNQNRQQSRARCFEIGGVFLAQDKEFQQQSMLGGAVYGEAVAPQWGAERREVDFHDLKADVEAVLALAGIASGVRFNPAQHPALHPGQTAVVERAGRRIGQLGRLHPRLQAELGLDQSVLVFELSVAALRTGEVPDFHEFSRFPSIRRDIAILVPAALPAQAVQDCIRESAGNLLVDLELFDEYRGKGIDSGRKSFALGLTFQDSSRTLNESDVERVMATVMSALESRLGAQQRQ